MNQAIFHKYNIQLSWVVKPFDEKLAEDIPCENSAFLDTIRRSIQNDEDGALAIFYKFRQHIKFCRGQFFFQMEHVWITDKNRIDNFLCDYITQCDLYMVVGKSKEKKPYSKNIKTAKLLMELFFIKVVAMCSDDALYDKFHTTTRGRLCFQDGVLDFSRGKFILWADVDFEYYTAVMIERPFAEFFANPNEEAMTTIENDIFNPLFGVECEKALQVFSRGVAGFFEDKAWVQYVGNRDCGKGVIDALAKTALGAYHTSITSRNLIAEKFIQGEQEKLLGWLLVVQFARLAIAQEVPACGDHVKMNGELIKKIASGGDEFQVRPLYSNSKIRFNLQCLLVIFGNNAPQVEPADTLEKCHQFSSTIQFKTQADYDQARATEPEMVWGQYRVGDSTIKDRAKTELWGNAFIMLMLRHFIHTAVPMKVRDNNEEDCPSLRHAISQRFEMSPDKFTPTKTFMDILKEMKMGDLTVKKLTIELNGLGLKKTERRTPEGKCRGWVGISPIKDDEEECEEGEEEV